MTPVKKNKKQEVKEELTTARKFEFQASSIHQMRKEQYKRLY